MGALCAAPTAMGLNDFMLYAWGDVLTDPQVKSTYLIISWFSFFLHSIAWKYLLRRIFIKYAWEPKFMWYWIQKKFNETFRKQEKVIGKPEVEEGHDYPAPSYYRWIWKWNR